jgi:EmrB/QacA subfamily drug resistance transporter
VNLITSAAQAFPMNRIIPLILAVALFMEQMDSTVIATALPTIAQDLNVGPITLKLALTSYMVALAIFIPISGWMADKFGAKTIFRLAIGVFMVGSLFCAVSGSLAEFVLSRFLQGMGGAMMTPVGRLVLLRTTDRKELVSAMALLTIPALLGPLTGPPVGGFITTYFSWHWIFLINIPIGVAGIVLSSIYLPVIETTNPPAMDVRGFILSSVAASGVVFGVSVISLPALPPTIGIASILTGIVAGVLYVIHARRHPAPILDFKIFQNTTFRITSVSGTIFRISTGAIPFLMPLMLQIGFGLNAFQSGMVTFAGAIGAITTKFIAKRMFAATGFKTTLIVASVVGAFTTAANALFVPETPHAIIISVLVVSGFARSFFFTGSNALSYSEIDNNQASQATSMSSVLQQISLALGVAFAATILEVSAALTGSHLQLADFHLAFVIVAAFSLLALIPLFRLDKNAGEAISGHRPKIK